MLQPYDGGEFKALEETAAQLSKKDVLARRETGLPAPDLVRSWQRSLAAIGDPGRVRTVPHVPEEILDEHLLDVVRAPMNTFADDLRGTGLALLLADSNGQILERWAAERTAIDHLDRMGTVRGAVLAEDAVGTNGVGTAIALARPVQVWGNEHFADFYQGAVCTSSPVLHPVTNGLVAVMTLSCDVRKGSELLKPLVRGMSRQIEAHLRSVEKPASLEMLHVFLEQSRKGGAPVIALGPHGSVLQSDNARRLNLQDLETLRNLLAEDRPTGRYVVELSTGRTPLELTSIGPSNAVVTLGDPLPRRTSTIGMPRVPLAGRSKDWMGVVRQIAPLRSAAGTVIIAGEPGVGKTSLALGVPNRLGVGQAPEYLHEAAARHIQGLEPWLSVLESTVRAHRRLVVRGIDTLDPAALDGLRAVIESQGETPSVLLTQTVATPAAVRENEIRFGAATVWVAPLRQRSDDLEDIWRLLADAIAPRAKLRLAPQTLTLMRRYEWPGNVKEMRRLVTRFAEIGRTGEIKPNELPATMQAAKNLSMIERAELDAIRRALIEAEGNRMKAADMLGISRATVYRKMKMYKLTDE
ncbi:sigma-54-dependent Fis family transcriptional regulator [Micromonospora sp. WMMD558]|uniref:sigma-54-dependent Fis family transcriptional regulator n=1 Tax=Micromonospora sp. WMMD558 TaxID=3403462 RepID=UPI003BF5D0E4